MLQHVAPLWAQTYEPKVYLWRNTFVRNKLRQTGNDSKKSTWGKVVWLAAALRIPDAVD